MTTTQPAPDHVAPSASSQVGAPPEPGTGAAGAGFRRDIEGLRAVAVLFVVLSHAGVGWFAGGYVGVDVFFVISGFLITSLLMRELLETGRVSIGRFYARRAVRLLPASSVVLVATLVGSWLWLSPLRLVEFTRDALASAFYWINIRMAAWGTDYFAAADAPSPFQHFWSLAVEEQFYLVWPLLIVAASWRSRRRGRANVRAVVAALLVLTVASFALSVMETDRSAPWAYFGPHTRAWELGLGAMVALGSARLGRLPAAVAAGLSWAGLGAMGLAVVLYDETTAFPGVAALLPVLGAVLVIAGGCRSPRYGAEALLRHWPFQTLGKLSYGWYLWHWPVLLIGPVALSATPRVSVNLLLSAGALVLAALSLRWVENPLRHRRSLRVRPVRGIGLGLSLSASTALVAVVAASLPPRLPPGQDAADIQRALAGSADPARLMAQLVLAERGARSVPANLTPPLTTAKKGLPAVYADGCHVTVPPTVPPQPCAYGDVDSDTTVVLFGDSHAAHWFPALERLAKQEHWKLVSMTKSSCIPADVPVWHQSLKRPYTECHQWRARVMKEIEELAPDLVVVSSYDGYPPPPDSDAAGWARTWDAGWGRALSALRETADGVAMIVDTPTHPGSIPDCVARHATDIARCATPTATALRQPALRAAAREQARRTGVTAVDPTPWLCAQTCPAVLGNVLVYQDAHHLTTVSSAMLAPILRTRLPLPPADGPGAR